MSERVQFVITAQEWDPSFEEVSPGGPEVGNPNRPTLVFPLSSDYVFPCGPLPRP